MLAFVLGLLLLFIAWQCLKGIGRMAKEDIKKIGGKQLQEDKRSGIEMAAGDYWVYKKPKAPRR